MPVTVPETVDSVAEELRDDSLYVIIDRAYEQALEEAREYHPMTYGRVRSAEERIAWATVHQLEAARDKIAGFINFLAPDELERRRTVLREEIEDARADMESGAWNDDERAAFATDIANMEARLGEPVEVVRSMLAASVERLAEGAR